MAAGFAPTEQQIPSHAEQPPGTSRCSLRSPQTLAGTKQQGAGNAGAAEQIRSLRAVINCTDLTFWCSQSSFREVSVAERSFLLA